MNVIKKRFDNRCDSWEEDYMFNLVFLKSVELRFHATFETCGWVFLRDIYEHLGIPVTKESCVLGWHKNSGIEAENMFEIKRIDDSSDYELIFKCYPILDYFD